MRSPHPSVYIAATSAFAFAWPAFAALQFAAIARADAAGTATVSLSAATSSGFAIGPLLGGTLAMAYGFGAVQLVAVVGVLTALLCLLPLKLQPSRLQLPTD